MRSARRLFATARSIALFAGVWVCMAVATAQPNAADPPLAGRPRQFSNVVGEYSVSVEAVPSSVAVEAPFTLRVAIRGQGPTPYYPRRADLRLFPDDFTRDYYLEPVPDEDHAQPEQGRWQFAWRLRPKHEGTRSIDGIKLVYWSPTRRKYQTAYAEPIELSVGPRTAAPPLPEDVIVHSAPASFYEVSPAAQVLAEPTRPFAIAPWVVVALLLAPPLLCGAGALWYRSRWSSRSAGQHDSEAARRAAARLAHDTMPVWSTMLAYLHDRFDFTAAEPTAGEIERLLRRRGASTVQARDFARVVVECGQLRFTDASPEVITSLRAEAGQSIRELEADLCAD